MHVSFRLLVPPSWIVEPRSGYAKIGGQALLHCKAEGFPPPTIVWKRIPPSRAGERPKEVEVINVRAGALLLPNGTLFLKNVTKDDEGRYICEATNGIGVGLSAVLYLTVNAPVQFKMRSRKEMVRRGTTAILSCHAVGDVPITFVWRKEGSFLELQGRTSAKNVANGLESELRINAVNSDDGGIYTCFARNEYGHDQTEIHLVVQDAPDHPTNVRLVDKGSRRVTIAWTPPLDGNSPITRYVVRHNFVIGSHSPFSRNVDFPSDLDVLEGPGVETSVEGTQSTAVISPLSPATTYSIQVVAENTLGPGTPSHEILVRTDEEAPSGGPLHLSVDALSSTQLILNWDPPALDQWNGPLLGHYVGYRYIGDMENKKQYNFTTVNFKGNGKEEARLGGLKKYSKYGLVVQAFNSRGPGPLSEEIQGHTLEDVPEAPPRDVRCSALSSESVQVSWQPPPEPLVHGVIQGYRLIYEPILPPTENGGGLFGLMVEFGAEDDEMMQSRTKTTTALTTTLHNLFKYTNYSIELIAFTRVGDGAKSHPMYCRTSEDVPGAPSDIKSVLITNKMTLIAWLPPKQPNGVITKYNIYVRVLEDGRQIDARSVPHTSTTHLQHRYADLNRQRRYEFWVTAFTRIGEGKSSTVAAISPATKLTSGIVSFGGTRVAGWKGDIILPCQTVGLPPPSRQWRRDGDTPVVPNPRTEIHPDGTLILHSLQRTDQGEYTCSVYNDQGNDRIAYQLVVQVPPSAPVLLMTGGSQDSLQLQWKIGDTGGTLVRGFVLHYKYEHGEWEEVELEGGARTHSLAGLRCGTRYHVFITAYNRVGTSEPSATLNVRTRGAVPLIPPDAELLAVNFTSVGINFHSWPDGGCPLLYFVVEYSHYIPGKEDHWEVVGNNIRDTSVYPLVGLTPGQTYKLRITAHNSAGSTITKYKFKTLSDQVGAMGPSQEVSRNDHELNWNLRVLLLTVASLATACLSFFSVCFCWKKRAFLGGLITRATRGSRPTRSEPQEVMQMPVQEVRKEMTHNEEYYASVRKIPPSPETLECIPEYSDEIRPYATFHVPAPPKTESTKLQTFAYREREMSTRRAVVLNERSLRSEYRRSKRTRPTEEYDSFGSESDTEPGTSSRTESSNQLDYGRVPPEASRAYHPHAVRLPDIGLEEMYPPHEWCSPAEISPRTHRRSFVRRNYQAHMMK